MTEQDARHLRLSANFTLWEFLYSESAIKYGLMHEQLQITEHDILNLKRLCINVLQPLRNEMRESIRINSGYRCRALNDKIGGSPTSDHMQGKAADIYVPGKMQQAFNTIKSKYKFRQLINEHNLSWIHVSYDEFDNKKQVLDL
jgi:predicted secreted protein